MKYYVGVDGGGTKTEVVVCDTGGEIVSRLVGTGSNPNDIGNANMLSVIEDLLADSLPDDCDCADVGLGISGISTAGSADFLREQLKKRFSVFRTVSVCSDVDAALNCAFDGDGCIAIMGTGNVVYLRNGQNIEQIGGGGYLIDAGFSGYDLGREALRAVLAAEDGRGEQTLLTGLFERITDENIRKHLKTVYVKGKAYIASFAKIAFDALGAGDHVAAEIFSRCISEFEKCLNVAYKKAGREVCTVALTGGLAKRLPEFRRFFSSEACNKFEFVYPEYPVVYGAVKQFINGDRRVFARTLKSSYEKLSTLNARSRNKIRTGVRV